MNFLVILNKKPLDGTDATWNALRLVKQAQKSGMSVRIFLMNEGIDLASEGIERMEGFDLQGMLLEAVSSGAEVKL